MLDALAQETTCPMRMILSAGFATLMAFPALADVTVETAQGSVSLPGAPAKVAALDLSVVDTMVALGVTPAGVPDKLYLDYLQPLAGTAAPVGTLQEPNLEGLAALGPDLIVVANRSAAKKDAVAQVAPAIDMTVDGADLIGQAKARLAALAALFGRQAEGEALAAALDGKLAALADAAAPLPGRAAKRMAAGVARRRLRPGERPGGVHRRGTRPGRRGRPTRRRAGRTLPGRRGVLPGRDPLARFFRLPS